jgi:crotonobetainyl-CoA:carnitine CoA-transferase CaiB-like acyl-CoA transferase
LPTAYGSSFIRSAAYLAHELLNGDTVGMYLGHLGADVIKIESPPGGDNFARATLPIAFRGNASKQHLI